MFSVNFDTYTFILLLRTFGKHTESFRITREGNYLSVDAVGGMNSMFLSVDFKLKEQVNEKETFYMYSSDVILKTLAKVKLPYTFIYDGEQVKFFFGKSSLTLKTKQDDFISRTDLLNKVLKHKLFSVSLSMKDFVSELSSISALTPIVKLRVFDKSLVVESSSDIASMTSTIDLISKGKEWSGIFNVEKTIEVLKMFSTNNMTLTVFDIPTMMIEMDNDIYKIVYIQGGVS